ncbi:bifunctional acetate--CoA ligase family protein/GNAT family N-acetyltransferase [Rhodoferax sp. 4810]|uniref:Bifunctional acetate--CoA ligase family protein/GNAT family N-acetyltransferase n=1 Tax=Thiospirillum jenense TaxID=1653858 RepID=A0A839HHS3_9GAMM|nr:bifunctional acetate--CoA ligase family protein/GNAT family N-acetyltransferase [Thiospirillum jenense]MBB1073370.1 bifunctional acetate--CoA ligase family protein/GNAT family N-acetyltransferase [Rhodoferax jenense]MBB1125722.1 bifunctional acetate--CoA ligase family protein/GNAT family N-acetyltransferase [Thiospirillum jenense]
MRLSDVDPLLVPTAVAVFGASDRDGSVGGMVFRNLLNSGFKGGCYAINPKYQQVADQPCAPSLAALDKHVDLALIATPAAQVAGILDQCGEYGVRAAVVHSAGFAEQGERGTLLQEKLVAAARRNRVRVLGPNCLGVMRPSHGLNATFGNEQALPGHVALVSQSGAVCTAMLDWSGPRHIGFSAVVSLGAAADVDFGDVLDYLALDAQTHSILLYVEGIRDARRFMSGLRAAARLKPVIVVKSGRHPAGSRAAKSHTGAWVGSAEIFSAVMERGGAVQVETLDQLFAAAQIFGAGKRLDGQRIAIVTNGGGPGVLAADRAVEVGLTLTGFTDATRAELENILPTHWSHGNPVDVIGDAPAARYGAAVRACIADAQVDGLLAILAPLASVEPGAVAEEVIAAAHDTNKPLVACWMGAARVADAHTQFSLHGVPQYSLPEMAIEALSFLGRQQRNQKLLMQSPGPLSHQAMPDVEGARLIIEGVMAAGRKTLGTIEAKAILSAFRIPTTQAILARSPHEALMAAEALSFPVAMKIHSPDLRYKSDVDGVRLNITDAQTVLRTFNELTERAVMMRPEARIEGVTVEHMVSTRAARELMVGVLRDPIFGPIISFGAGGTGMEVLGDRALGLPPLNAFIIQTMIEHTRVARLMGAFGNVPPMNREALAQILQRVSELVCELPEIITLEINPLIGNDVDVIAVDARIEVNYRPPQMPVYGHMAIYPYPQHLIELVPLPDGTELTIRPIRPEDAEMEQEFVRGLSEQTKYFRFMQAIKELTPEMLVRFTQIDYDREMALIGVVNENGREVEVGVSRYMSRPGGDTCEFAIVVSDHWRNRGIGARLMRSLMNNARLRGLRMMEGEVLTANTRMLSLMKSLGFRIETDRLDPGIKLVSKVL